MRKRISIVRGISCPAHAATRPRAFKLDLQFEPLEVRCLLTGVPELLGELNPGGSSDPAEFVNLGGTVFFSGDNGTNGSELWKTNGTTAGTEMVKDIGPLGAGSSPSFLTVIGDTLFFAADDGTNGVELWKSDGTTAGTTLVKDINAAGSSLPSELTNVDGTLYFQADDGAGGVELWKSDGTEPGTMMVMDIDPAGSSNPQFLTAVGGKLFFSADDGTDGRELWLSDPIASSTTMVKDINPGGSGSSPGLFGAMVDVGGVLFFSAFDATNGFELWSSDGTSGGTTLVKDINTGGGSSFPSVMVDVGGALFFTADDGSNGFELWTSDGTLGGTTLVRDINTTPGVGSIPDGLAAVGGTLFFRADNGTDGVELWKSDGTFGGTEMVLDINTSGNSSPRFLTNVNGTLFFRANEGTSPGMTGSELWQSDGTPGGTTLVMDIAPGEASSDPKNLVNINGSLLFSAESATDNQEPWVLRAPATSVVATRLFYNQSLFDWNDPAANAADDDAIATDKIAYLPTAGLATFASVSSYSKGINGVMFDLSGTHGTLSAGDLTLRVGASNTPASWPLAPEPLSVTVRDGAGVDGSDRVEIIWANNAIEKTWLQVTVNANLNTNLDAPYIFLFGNLPGDSGMGNAPTLAIVDATDALFARSSGGFADVTSLADYNRDGFIDASDEIFARDNPGLLLMLDVDSLPPPILGRYLFYNQSLFDNNEAAANSNDDLAIATDKSAYLADSGSATFDSISSYSRGINGIMIDIPGSHPGITEEDFSFRTGDTNTPGTWTLATAPSTVLVRAGAGIGGSDRVELIWDDGDIVNTWLEVVMAANANTGLADPDIFYFGSRIGDTGSDVSTMAAITDAIDEIETRTNQGLAPLASNAYDFDRDGVVSASDQIIVRDYGGFLTKINIITPPPAPMAETPSSGPGETGGNSGMLDAVGSSLSASANRAGGTTDAAIQLAVGPIPPGEGHRPVERMDFAGAAEDGPRGLALRAAAAQFAEVPAPDDDLLDELIAGLGRP